MILTIKINNPSCQNKKIQTYFNPEYCKDSVEQVRYVKKIVNKWKIKNILMLEIKTRSIYVTATLSNLMTAFCVAKKNLNAKKEIAHFIPERLWIDPSNVTFYNGNRQLYLWDEKTQRIDDDFLDSGARKINEEWEKLSNIKGFDSPYKEITR